MRRLLVEKPFGTDLKSAKELNDIAHRYFDESQIFRIDHYLGKETVQNLMVMRFANAIFEPIWNYKYIDHVQITVAESLGVGTRGGYYDKSGALRDMVQNHIFQLMALVAMEPPVALDAQSIRDDESKGVSVDPGTAPSACRSADRARAVHGWIDRDRDDGRLFEGEGRCAQLEDGDVHGDQAVHR